VPLLVDADLTGTSLADGLALCAPKVPTREDGSMDLEAAPTGERWTRDETKRLRNRRKGAALGPPPPPFLNDALTYEAKSSERDCRVDAMLWTHEQTDNVLYLPSSPLRQDVETSAAWIHGDEPFQWVRRLAWILDALLSQRPDVTDIVVDLPPGIVGFTHEVLVLLAALASDKALPEGYPVWKQADEHLAVRAFLITTADWNDLVPALEYVTTTSVQLPALTLLPLVNKVDIRSMSDLKNEVREHIDPVLRPLGLEERLRYVDELRTSLGRIFRQQNLVITDDVKRLENDLLAKEER
jgi:hypothetical protein